MYYIKQMLEFLKSSKIQLLLKVSCKASVKCKQQKQDEIQTEDLFFPYSIWKTSLQHEKHFY